MANVFKKRCACGAVLALREGCSVCAARERARLHASGVGVSERDERQRVELRARVAARARWDAINLPERREYFCVPPPHGKPASMNQALNALRQAKVLTGIVPYAVLTADPEGPVLYWLDDDHRLPMPAFTTTTPRIEPMMPAHCAKWMRDSNSGDGGFVVLRDGELGWRWTVTSKGDVAIDDPTGVRFSPLIGAEVQWEVAEWDMRRRWSAVYEPQDDVGGRFSYRSGTRLMYRDLHGAWLESSMSYAHRQAVRWVRVA